MTLGSRFRQVMNWPATLFVLASLVLFFPYCVPSALADDGGKGFEYCYTNHPGATGYIAGQPTFVSAVFAYNGNSYNGPALSTYVSQKYGVKNPGPVGCSYGGTLSQVQNGFSQTMAKLKAAGTNVVETGWVLGPAAPAPGAVSAAPSNTPSTQYWVCHSVGAKVLYLSGVINHDNPPTSPAMTNAFNKFLEAQYNLKNAGTTCVLSGSDQEARAVLKNFAAPSNTAVQTGWIYTAQPTPVAAAPTGPGSYWICRVTGGDGKDYNSSIFTGPDSGYSSFPNAFGQFVKSKYNLKSFEGSPTCTDYGVQGQQQAKDAMKGFASYSTAVLTGWKSDTAIAAPAAVGKNGAAAAAGTYFVCTWPTSSAGVLTFYVSDVNGPASLGELAPAFGKFVTAKYHPSGGAYNCAYKFSQADAEGLKKLYLTTWAPKGYKPVDTGWKYGETAAPGAAPASAPSSPPVTAASGAVPAAAPAPMVQAPPASATIVMRLVDPVNSANDQPGKQYRAVVTQAATAGSVSIPVNTLAKVTLAQSGSTWIAQLSSLSLNGQTVAVTSSSVSATSPTQQNAQKLGSVLSGLGGFGKKAPSVSGAMATAIASGDHVILPPGTSLTFTALVPQPPAPGPASASAPAPSSAAPSSTTPAAPVPGQPLPQAGNGKQALCFAATGTNRYVSAIFHAKYVNPGDEAPWVQAFFNYVATHFDPKIQGVRCHPYQSAAAAQAALKSWSQPGGLHVTETGWVYKGPEPGLAGNKPNGGPSH